MIEEEPEEKKYSLTISIPFPSKKEAGIVYKVLKVDKEPPRSLVTKELSCRDNILTASERKSSSLRGRHEGVSRRASRPSESWRGAPVYEEWIKSKDDLPFPLRRKETVERPSQTGRLETLLVQLQSLINILRPIANSLKYKHLT